MGIKPRKYDMRYYAAAILNLLIILGVLAGIVIMLLQRRAQGELSSVGLSNLKYFTVLSNLFCGVVACMQGIRYLRRNRRPFLLLKLMAAAAVGLTFLVIAAFLGPIYGHVNLYQGSNLMYHLIVPLLAMAEFLLLDAGEGKIPFRYTVYSAIPTFVYGMGYLINILVNGVGEWPDTNDWYGFVLWGLPIGIGIFAAITVATWGIACVLRALNEGINQCLRKMK